MYCDQETSLCLAGDRYYDPKSGRWITPDRLSVAWHVERWKANMGSPVRLPLESNPYAYVANNPLRWVDQTGEFLNVPGGIYGAIAGGVSGYISSRGSWKGVAYGAAAGGAVGLLNPFSSNVAGAAAGGFVASIFGQGAANWGDPCKDLLDIDYKLAIVSSVGGGAGRGLVNYLNTPTRSASAFILNRGLGAGSQVANNITSGFVRGGVSGFAQLEYKREYSLFGNQQQNCQCQAR